MAEKTSITEASMKMNAAIYGGAFNIAASGVKKLCKLAATTTMAAAPESALGRFSARFLNAAKPDATHTVPAPREKVASRFSGVGSSKRGPAVTPSK